MGSRKLARGLMLGVIAICLIGGVVLWNRRPAQPPEAPRGGVTVPSVPALPSVPAPSGAAPRLPAGVTPGTLLTPHNAVMTRYLRARAIQKMFEEHGYKIKCDAVEAKHVLVVAGPSVDRAFADRFMNTPPLLKSIREVGFNVIGFWHGPYLTGTHLEDFPLEASVAPEK